MKYYSFMRRVQFHDPPTRMTPAMQQKLRGFLLACAFHWPVNTANKNAHLRKMVSHIRSHTYKKRGDKSRTRPRKVHFQPPFFQQLWYVTCWRSRWDPSRGHGDLKISALHPCLPPPSEAFLNDTFCERKWWNSPNSKKIFLFLFFLLFSTAEDEMTGTAVALKINTFYLWNDKPPPQASPQRGSSVYIRPRKKDLISV